MISLRLLGRASLVGDDGPLTGPAAQRHRLALLALLAVRPSRTRTRDTLMAALWPTRDTEHARKLLNQSVYVLRRALGEDVLVSTGEELRLDLDRIGCDLAVFEHALAGGDLEAAVEVYGGPFINGFHLSGAPEFERWVDSERARLADAYGRALEDLAGSAREAGQLEDALTWWKARAAHDPYDSRVASELIKAFAAAGNPGGAIRHAAAHQARLQEDLGIDAPPRLAALAERLRDESGSDPLVATPAFPGEASQLGSRAPPDSPKHGGALPHRLRRTAALSGVLLLVVLAYALARRGPPDAPAQDDRPAAVDALVDSVAREVARRIAEDTDLSFARSGTQNLAAYEAYLVGNRPELLRSAEGAREGFEHLRRAVALDPSYSAAWAALACLALRVSADDVTDLSRDRLHGLAENAALRAVALDGESGAAHAALGLVRMAAFEFMEAERHLERAIDLDPTLARAREWLLAVYLWTGRPEEALDEARRAVAVEPMSAAANAELARALAANGRCQEALIRLATVRTLEPPLLRAGPIAATCYANVGDWRGAVAAMEAVVHGDPNVHALALLGYTLSRAGERERALAIHETLVGRAPATGFFPVAISRAGLGDLDGALGDLHRAIDDGSLHGSASHYQILGLVLTRLADHPSHEQLRARLRLPPG